MDYLESDARVSFKRLVHGYATGELVFVDVALGGEVIGWREILHRPNGISQEEEQAIAALDLDLCQNAVRSFVSRCEKRYPQKEIELVSFSPLVSFEFATNGALLCSIVADVTVDGFTAPLRFYVELIAGDGVS